MSRVLTIALVVLVGSCSLVIDADRDRLGPQIDVTGDCSQVESCDDHVSCTNDYCDSTTGQCVHEPHDELCAGGTCDEHEGCAGADVPCEHDQDCVDDTGCSTGTCGGNGQCEWAPIDADQDGTALCGGDCDDTQPSVHPGQPEVCGNGADDDCNGATDAGDAACAGGDCGTVLVIHDAGAVDGEVRGGGDMNSTVCDRASGPEALVELDLSHESDVVISTEGSDFDTILYLRQGCDGAELGCSDNRSQFRHWLDSRLFMLRLAAGTYTIVVDSVDRDHVGQFHLEVASDNPRAPTCDRPLDISGGGTVIGRTDDGGDIENDASCNTRPQGTAAVFQFDLDRDGEVRVSSVESEYDLAQDIQSDQCGGTTPEGACADRTQFGEEFQGWLWQGHWIVILDGFDNAAGRYVLRYFP